MRFLGGLFRVLVCYGVFVMDSVNSRDGATHSLRMDRLRSAARLVIAKIEHVCSEERSIDPPKWVGCKILFKQAFNFRQILRSSSSLGLE